jgi:BirA family biotin operon repressor/biotin-[acetyl-CoA-carboxylase] ligase
MIGSTIVHLDSVDSTNNYAAKALLTKSLNEGTVFVAACQEAGRGQANSSWESDAGLNLTFSIVLYPAQVEIARQFSLSQAISLGVADFLDQFVGGVAIKWPNDIYVSDKKIAGILIETAISGGKFSNAIVGIGLNVNQEKFVSDAPNPVSLRNLTGENYDLTRMLNLLCYALDKRYHSLITGNQNSIRSDYEQLLFKKGIWARYKDEVSDFDGMIAGVELDGKLVIETRSGNTRGYYFKEVAFV